MSDGDGTKQTGRHHLVGLATKQLQVADAHSRFVEKCVARALLLTMLAELPEGQAALAYGFVAENGIGDS